MFHDKAFVLFSKKNIGFEYKVLFLRFPCIHIFICQFVGDIFFTDLEFVIEWELNTLKHFTPVCPTHFI